MDEQTKVVSQEQPRKDPTVEELLKQLEEIKTKSVDKELYDKALEDNRKLIKSLSGNRPSQTEETKEKVNELEIVKKRTAEIENMGPMQQFDTLCKNYRFMRKNNMEVVGVDEKVVEGIEKILAESNGNERTFKSLMDASIVASAI